MDQEDPDEEEEQFDLEPPAKDSQKRPQGLQHPWTNWSTFTVQASTLLDGAHLMNI